MNARFYLPEVGRFVTADTIVPDPADPQNFNRYAYVLNNPLKLVDPTGHCGVDLSEHLTNQCETLQGELEEYYHVDITGQWAYTEILVLQLALQDVANAVTGLGGQAYFIEIFATTQINRERVWQGESGEAANAAPDGMTINIFNEAFAHGEDVARWAIIHETVHIWDIRSGFELTTNHFNAIDGRCVVGTNCGFSPDDPQGSYRPNVREEPLSLYAYANPAEDTAETLTSLIFRGDQDLLRQNNPAIVGNLFNTATRLMWGAEILQNQRIATTVNFDKGR